MLPPRDDHGPVSKVWPYLSGAGGSLKRRESGGMTKMNASAILNRTSGGSAVKWATSNSHFVIMRIGLVSAELSNENTDPFHAESESLSGQARKLPET